MGARTHRDVRSENRYASCGKKKKNRVGGPEMDWRVGQERVDTSKLGAK